MVLNTQIRRRQSGRQGRTIKQVGTSELKRLNDLSIAKDYNRNLSDRFFDDVDRRGTHILSVQMIHEHAHMRKVAPHYRCLLLAKMRGRRDPAVLFLDLPFEAFDALRSAVG